MVEMSDCELLEFSFVAGWKRFTPELSIRMS